MSTHPKDRDGLTAAEWLREQFVFENCAVCRRGSRSHDAVPVLGNWFARCRPVVRRVKAS